MRLHIPTVMETFAAIVSDARCLITDASPADAAGDAAARYVDEVRSGGFVYDIFSAAFRRLANTSRCVECVLAGIVCEASRASP